MKLGRVIGNVVSTVKTSCHHGSKLMIVKPIDLNKQGIAPPIIAIDSVQAGIGDIVLIVEEGGSSREALEKPQLAIDALIVGIVDYLD